MDGAWPAANTLDVAGAAAARALVMLWLIADCVRRAPPEWVTLPLARQAEAALPGRAHRKGARRQER